MIIIGIDPGTAMTGYGVIREMRKSRKRGKDSFKCLDYGLIKTDPCFTAAERLKKINEELKKLIEKYRPNILAVENIYFFKNLKTVMFISQAKGVILLTAAQKKIPTFEVTPLQVKMVVTGYGRAEKEDVQKKLKRLLKLKKLPSPDDAADALGVAVCCAIKTKKA